MPSIIKPNTISIDQLLNTLDQLGVYIYIKDLELRYIYANDKVCDYFGCSHEQIIGASSQYFLGDNTEGSVLRSDRQVIQQGETVDCVEKSFHEATGQFHYYSTVKQPLYDEQGDIIGLFGVSTDITEHKIAQQELQRKEQHLSAILDNIGACIYIKDNSHRFEYVNRMTEDLFHNVSDNVLGKRNDELLGKKQGDAFDKTDREVFETRDLVTCLETFQTSQGARYYWTVKAPLFDDKDNVESLIGMSTDITSQITLEKQLRSANQSLNQRIKEVEALRAELEESAIRDPLTGLYNRRYLDDFVHKEWARSERNQHPISVALLDLDRFKLVNDNYGHATGDKVLVEFARLLNAVARKTDVACRFGGEEFVLLMPGAPLEIAVERAEQFLQTVAAMYIEAEGQVIHVTTSAGVASYPDDAVSFEGLVAIADRALYRAKENGRNQVVSSLQLAEGE